MEIKDQIKQIIPDVTEENLTKFDTLLTNILTAQEKTIFSDAQNKAYSNVDNIFNELQIPKPAEKKTSEFVKELLTSKNEENKKLIAELEKFKANPNPNTKDFLDQITSLQNALQTNKTDFENQLKQTQSEKQKELTKFVLLSQLPKINAKLPESAIKIINERAVNDLMAIANYENGLIVFRNPDGSVKLNPENLQNPFTTADMVSKLDYFAPLLKDNGQETPVIGDAKNTNATGSNGVPSVEEIHNLRAGLIAQGKSEMEIFQIIKEKYPKK